MEINATKIVKVNVKTLDISAKCSDCFSATLADAEGRVVKEHDGYVPRFMPGEHYGDYVMLKIDIDTGQILNWKAPTAEQLESFINEED